MLPHLGGGVFYVVAPFFFKINLKIRSLKVCAYFAIEFDLLKFFVFSISIFFVSSVLGNRGQFGATWPLWTILIVILIVDVVRVNNSDLVHKIYGMRVLVALRSGFLIALMLKKS